MNENENHKDLKNEENENKSDIINNKDKINNPDKIIEDSKQKENSTNLENNKEIITNNENDKLNEQNMEQKILDYEAKLKEIQDINISLNNKISNNELNLQAIKIEKINLEKRNNELESKIKILKENYEKTNSEKERIILENKSEMKKLQQDLDDMNNNNMIINQATKQIFLQYLTNDIYIEQIEKCFNNQDINKYFDDIYKLSEYIKPNIIIDYWKNILTNNKDLVNNIEKYNLDTSLEKIGRY